MNLLWITDPHFNFLGGGKTRVFGESCKILFPRAEACVITGDIGECGDFMEMLGAFADGLERDVFFVLGNHDAYSGGVKEMQGRAAEAMHGGRNDIWYLPHTGLRKLTDGVCLIGVDGWYDARLGKPKESKIVMNDFLLVREMRVTDVVKAAQKIADNEAGVAVDALDEAARKGYKRIVFATHVPPYAEATWHEGKMSDAHWLPWMSSYVMGDVLDHFAAHNPNVTTTVLCGHTHSPGIYDRRPNLQVRTGSAAYHKPRVSEELRF
jgi:predicted phosphodiesterase